MIKACGLGVQINEYFITCNTAGIKYLYFFEMALMQKQLFLALIYSLVSPFGYALLNT